MSYYGGLGATTLTCEQCRSQIPGCQVAANVVPPWRGRPFTCAECQSFEPACGSEVAPVDPSSESTSTPLDFRNPDGTPMTAQQIIDSTPNDFPVSIPPYLPGTGLTGPTSAAPAKSNTALYLGLAGAAGLGLWLWSKRGRS